MDTFNFLNNDIRLFLDEFPEIYHFVEFGQNYIFDNKIYDSCIDNLTFIPDQIIEEFPSVSINNFFKYLSCETIDLKYLY